MVEGEKENEQNNTKGVRNGGMEQESGGGSGSGKEILR
jgi:hypothetical protein